MLMSFTIAKIALNGCQKRFPIRDMFRCFSCHMKSTLETNLLASRRFELKFNDS